MVAWVQSQKVQKIEWVLFSHSCKGKRPLQAIVSQSMVSREPSVYWFS
jgi:hypothetical protein